MAAIDNPTDCSYLMLNKTVSSRASTLARYFLNRGYIDTLRGGTDAAPPSPSRYCSQT
jgi:hypothetical protein